MPLFGGGLFFIGGANLNPTENVVPVRQDDRFRDSNISIVRTAGEPDIALVDGDIQTTLTASLLIGDSLRASSDASNFRIDDTLENQRFLAAKTDLNADGTTGDTFAVRYDNRRNVVVQPLDNEVQTGNFTFTAPITFTRVIKTLEFKPAQDATGIRVVLKRPSGEIIYTSDTDREFERGECISLTAIPEGSPDWQVIELESSVKLVQGDVVEVLVEQSPEGTGTLALRGSTITIAGVTGFFVALQQKTLDETRDVIWPNGQVISKDSDFRVEGGYEYAVDTTGGAVNVTVDPDEVQQFSILDAYREFTVLTPCIISFEEPALRATPNVSITRVQTDRITALSVSAGANEVAFSDGAVDRVYYNGTHWVVELDGVTLNFNEITSPSGNDFIFNLGDERAYLSLSGAIQFIDLLGADTLYIDTIGDSVNPISSIYGAKLAFDEAVVYDDKIVGNTGTLRTRGDTFKFYWDGLKWRLIDLDYGRIEDV